MMLHRKPILLVASLLIAIASHALTLQEARQAATDRYPLMKDYGLIALTEQYTVENAAKAWLPQLLASAQASWQSATPEYPEVLREMLEQRGLDVEGLAKFQYKAGVDVRQTIWDGGRVKAAQDVARAEAIESRSATEGELYQLRARIDNLYFGTLLLEQQRQAIDQAISLLQANLDKMNSLVRNGAAMQSDADAVHAELLSTRQQLASVDAAIGSYRAILGLYLGTDGSAPLSEPEETVAQNGNDASGRPESALFAARKGLLAAKANEINASARPQIGAFAQGYFGYPGMNFMEAMMRRSPNFNALIGLSATWNISSLYTRKNRLATIDAAKLRIDAAQEAFDFNISLQASQQRHEMQRLRALAETDAEIVALRERVRKASEARLREGAAEPTELLLRITEEKNARIAANSHRIEYLKALYSLQNILNQ